MSDFERLVEWLHDQGVAPTVEETTFGWRLTHNDLHIKWDLDTDFSLRIAHDGQGTRQNLSLADALDVLTGWFS